MRASFLLAFAGLAAALTAPIHELNAQATLQEPTALVAKVAAGDLPPVSQRIPRVPHITRPLVEGQTVGRYGGELTMLMARARDTRVIFAISHARLVRWTPALTLEPDILERVEVQDGRTFTLHLRPGHRWSDGQPFTTEDFRYWWEDIANNTSLTPFGAPAEILVDGEAPKVEILSETAVRYGWTKPNPYFLPGLAGSRPIQLYAPAHYLKRFHDRYTDAETLKQRVQAAGQRNWAQMHNRLDNSYNNDNPDLPSLQPWVPTVAPPAERFVFARNPYFHRVDSEGRQLPYVDSLIMQVADSRLIPAKAGAGETDLQARYIRFDNYTFLRQSAERNGYDVRLWKNGSGAHLTLFPNLNAADPVWRAALRDVRVRRALSVAIDRDEINHVVYFGLAVPSQNTVIPESPLFNESYRSAATKFDVQEANRLLDAAGLDKRDRSGTRLLPDGRPVEIIVETAGESSEETDVLQLVADSWRKIGVRMFTRPSQLDVLRNRVYSGETLMVIGKGLDNGIPSADMPPTELVPVDQAHYQWPKWGQFFQTRGGAGEAPDMPEASELMRQLARWQTAPGTAQRAEAWHDILRLHAQHLFTIGIIAEVQQPVVVRRTLKNVPASALFNFDPGGFFGIYQPETFWFDKQG